MAFEGENIISESHRKRINRIENLPLPKTIPRITFKYGQSCTKKNRPVLISYGQKNIFIDSRDITSFQENVIGTKTRYVYPIEFVKIGKKYGRSTFDLFDENDLYTLQIWANQLREFAESEDATPDKLSYLTYMICLKIIEFTENK